MPEKRSAGLRYRYQRLNEHSEGFNSWLIDYLLFLADRPFLVKEFIKEYLNY